MLRPPRWLEAIRSPSTAPASYDPDGDPITWQWSQVSSTTPITLSATDQAIVTFTVPATISVPETAVFGLTVSDDRGASGSTTVSVILLPNYSPPRAVPQASPSPADAGTTVTLDGSNSTVSPGLSLTYQWQQLNSPPDPAVTLSAGDQAVVTFTTPPTASTSLTLTFQLTVSDGSNANSATVDVVVAPTNQPPVAVAALTPLHPVLIGDTVTLDGSGSYDPDDDPITFFWQQLNSPPDPGMAHLSHRPGDRHVQRVGRRFPATGPDLPPDRN